MIGPPTATLRVPGGAGGSAGRNARDPWGRAGSRSPIGVSKVGGDAVLFPIPIAGRLGTPPAALLARPRLSAGALIKLAPAGFRFQQRPLRMRGKVAKRFGGRACLGHLKPHIGRERFPRTADFFWGPPLAHHLG